MQEIYSVNLRDTSVTLLVLTKCVRDNGHVYLPIAFRHRIYFLVQFSYPKVAHDFIVRCKTRQKTENRDIE